MVKKISVWLFCICVLAACGSANKDYIVKDPLFEDQENFIIYRADGTRDYLMRDPIFEKEENYLLFRSDDSRDYLLRDPIFEKEENYILFKEVK